MGLFSGIRNLLGLRKDLVETKKAKLESKKLEQEIRDGESLIQKPDSEEVKEYDPKIKELIRRIRIKIRLERPGGFGDEDRLYDISAPIIIFLGLLIVLIFAILKIIRVL